MKFKEQARDFPAVTASTILPENFVIQEPQTPLPDEMNTDLAYLNSASAPTQKP
ncbi:MAG TPA: hypothetical protein PLY09_00785 [Methanothrix sp.]|nr:hypothetical protein [Methanothrix sp.]